MGVYRKAMSTSASRRFAHIAHYLAWDCQRECTGIRDGACSYRKGGVRNRIKLAGCAEIGEFPDQGRESIIRAMMIFSKTWKKWRI
jgi:hypothetical protein